mgnify:CR=1 FL=1
MSFLALDAQALYTELQRGVQSLCTASTQLVGVHSGGAWLAERLPGPLVKTDQDYFDYACRHAKTDHHPVGTCRMGADPAAVVDPQLHFNGITGLRVADASIMPTLIAGNTNAPAMMIGEKCARAMLAP